MNIMTWRAARHVETLQGYLERVCLEEEFDFDGDKDKVFVFVYPNDWIIEVHGPEFHVTVGNYSERFWSLDKAEEVLFEAWEMENG